MPPPYPGQPYPPKKKLTTGKIIAGVIGGIVLASCGICGIGAAISGSSDKTTTAEPSPAAPATSDAAAPADSPVDAATTDAAPPPRPAGSIPGDGTFLVPGDVKPGTYRTTGGEGCYWARLKDASGDMGGILANDNVTGPTVVTIRRTDGAFQTSRCGDWTKIG